MMPRRSRAPPAWGRPLAEMVTDVALERDWTVITTVADEMERQSPFDLLQSTLLRTRHEPARRLDLGSVLADVPVPGDPGGFDPGGARLAVATRLDRILAGRTARSWWWPKTSTGRRLQPRRLRSLSRPAEQLPLLLVLTGRPESDWQGALGNSPRSEIRRGALSEEDACELAERHVNGSLGPIRCRGCVGRGNPLLVIEYIRGMAMEDRLVRVGDVIDSSGSGAPTNVQSLAARRLRSLPPRLIEVLETAAVLGRASDGEMLDELCELGEATLAELLEPAEVAGIISFDGATVVYEHDLFRDAVYAGIADRRRTELHRRVAHAFAAVGRPVISVAAHAPLSGSERDDQTVAWIREPPPRWWRWSRGARSPSSTGPLPSVTTWTSAFTSSTPRSRRSPRPVGCRRRRSSSTCWCGLDGPRRPRQVRYGGLLMAQAKANEARATSWPGSSPSRSLPISGVVGRRSMPCAAMRPSISPRPGPWPSRPSPPQPRPKTRSA